MPQLKIPRSKTIKNTISLFSQQKEITSSSKKMSAAVIQTTTPTEINFLGVDNQGEEFKVRLNIEKKLLLIFDLIGGMSGIKTKGANRVAWLRLRNDYPDFVQKCTKSKFLDFRQKQWACDADTGRNIVKSKVSKMDTFNFSSNGCTLHPFTQNTIKLSY